MKKILASIMLAASIVCASSAANAAPQSLEIWAIVRCQYFPEYPEFNSCRIVENHPRMRRLRYSSKAQCEYDQKQLDLISDGQPRPADVPTDHGFKRSTFTLDFTCMKTQSWTAGSNSTEEDDDDF
jgi:hypothetical protein